MTWHRRIIPAGYAMAALNLEGTSPLLMSCGEADLDSELYRAFFLLGQKRNKSLDDQARLREMEWQLRLYLDNEIGPYIPGKNIKEMLRQSATKWRKGEEIKRSLVVSEYRIPLIYKGPRDQQGLWDEGFRYTARVANAGVGSGRVIRCRPMFEYWSLDVEIAYDPEELDFDFLQLVAERSQKYGLGDYRPEFGSFKIILTEGVLNKSQAKGDATKRRNRLEMKAHSASTKRIVA
jgi:hypothetical protein